MAACIEAGVAMVNDVEALRAPGALACCAASDVAVCVMHMQGTPQTMQVAPHYDDVVTEVSDFLGDRVTAMVNAGISRERIVIDPGFGFGKTVEHNLQLLRGLARLSELGLPILAGLSRKSVLGAVTGRTEDDRIHASVAAALIAVTKGARIVRVHDVAATESALAVWAAVEG
jgi:dihydropteroate synthase